MSAKIGAPGSPGDSSSGNRLTRRYNNRKNLTGWALRRERARRYIKNVWEYWTEVPIWKQPIKHIEGEFGAGVASFFVFLKSLFLMNLAMLVLTTSFIILPMAVQWHQVLFLPFTRPFDCVFIFSARVCCVLSAVCCELPALLRIVHYPMPMILPERHLAS